MARTIVISTYNKEEVHEVERVFRYKGHPLNQLQQRAFAWHIRRLNALVRLWQYSGAKSRVQFRDGTEQISKLKQGIFPTIYGKQRKVLDLYNVYNILPIIDGKPTASQTYPYLPSKREFLYLEDLTDFRQLENTD